MQCLRSFVAVRLAMIAATSALAGCNGSPAADTAQVEEILRSVLDAWKEGRKLDEPAGADHVAEPRWKAGYRLERYEVGSKFEPTGLDVSCPVELWMRSPAGKAVHEQVHYIVSTTPRRVVIRSPS
jgi:hypothetical protein